MPNSSDADKSSSEPDDSPTGPPRVYQSEELFLGQREVWIEHGDVLYRLRITTTGKLILTK